MKKILLGICALGLFASCDPSKDSVGVPTAMTESELAAGFTYTQTDEAGSPSSTGNFFQYTAPRVVTIYRLNSSGGQIILAKGSSAGSFILKPTRGSDPTQTFYVQSREFDGSVVTASFNVTVDVPGDLTTEMKIACSDNGTKTWTWDGSVHASGAVWGNIGYTPGEDWTSGYWWGCPAEELTGQLQHSDTGVATGEEDSRAYMIFSEEGTITTYDAGGNQIRKGAFEIQDYNNGEKIVVNDVPWKVGTLHTDAGTILWPFEINWKDKGHTATPTDFDIVKLTADKLQLTYAAPGTGSWTEATYWCFKSNTDLGGMLAGYDEAGKDWTWDGSVHESGAVWGNMGYCGGSGADVGTFGNGYWWGVTTSDEFNGQLQHTDTGTNIGDGDMDATMNFAEGQVTCYDASGKQIRKGAYELVPVTGNEWKVADLKTDAGSILWPFQINWKDNGFPACPTVFEVVYMTGSQFTLVYPDGGDFGALGNWGEATYWHFKAK